MRSALEIQVGSPFTFFAATGIVFAASAGRAQITRPDKMRIYPSVWSGV